MADERVAAATGRTWPEWTALLDAAGAAAWPHSKIAVYVHQQGVRPWWTQMVAVGYERIKGMRAIGQRMDGSYEAARSRTLPISLSRLYAAVAGARARAAWLGQDSFTLRKATRNKTIRLRHEDGAPVEFYFTAPSRGKAQIAVSHRKLSSKAEAERWKKFWGARLDELAGLIKGG